MFRSSEPRRRGGFTLIELMVTVFIVSVLTVVAGVKFVRSMRQQRMSAEVNLVFANMKTRLDLYKNETTTYVTTNAVTDDGSIHPSNPSSTAQNWQTGKPAYWTDLGLNPGKATVYCGYVAFAGTAASDSTTAWPAGAHTAGFIFGTSYQPQEAWYYLRAVCDLENSGSPVEWRTRFDNATVWQKEGDDD